MIGINVFTRSTCTIRKLMMAVRRNIITRFCKTPIRLSRSGYRNSFQILARFMATTQTVEPKTSKVTLPSKLINEFQQNGAVCIRGAFDKAWIDLVQRGIEKNLANPSSYCDWLEGEDEDGFYFNDYFNWDKIEEIETYVRSSPAAKLAGLLMQSNIAVFFHEHVFVKRGAKGRAAPWHHDQSYYPLDGKENCTIWMPTSSLDKESSLKFIKGSHLWPKWFYPRNFGTHVNYEESQNTSDKKFEDLPKIDENEHDIISWNLEPGDCLAFHMKVLHATNSSYSESPRHVLATRWVGEDAILDSRPWETSPPKDLLPKDIKLGDRYYKSQRFPTIWKRSSK